MPITTTLALLVGTVVAFAETYPGEPAPAWDVAFQRSDGWTGGDAIYSTSLPDDRTLWLFADSWVGRVADGKHVAGSRLVNNTLAIHATPHGGIAPEPRSIRFLWGPQDDEGHPTAWIRPETVKSSAASENNHGDAGWYWLADALVAPGPDGKPRLIIFLWHIGRTEGSDGVFNFKSLGGRLAIVDNPRATAEEWRPRQFDIPHFVGTDAASRHPHRRQITWGSELTAHTENGVPWIYIYGTVQDESWTKKLVLARTPADSIENPAKWTFRTSNGWSRNLSDVQFLADGVTSEFSVHKYATGSEAQWIITHSEPIFGDRIFIRTSPTPHGPWSNRKPIYRVPGVAANEAYFTYAAKAHPQLSPKDHLLVSYVINSHDFGAMVRDANIYRPRFIHVPYASIVQDRK